MTYKDINGNPTDDIQNAADFNERDYSQAITDKVNEYVANYEDLDDAIINDDDTLSAIRALYRSHVELKNPLYDQLNMSVLAKTVCMHIDSHLINRATKELG